MTTPQKPNTESECSDAIQERLDDLEENLKNSLVDIVVLFGRQFEARRRAADPGQK